MAPEEIMGFEHFSGMDLGVRVMRYDPTSAANSGKIFEQDLYPGDGYGQTLGWFVDGNYLYAMKQDGSPQTSLHRWSWDSGTSQYVYDLSYSYGAYYGIFGAPGPDNLILTRYDNYLFWSISPGAQDATSPLIKLIDATTGTDYGDLTMDLSGYSQNVTTGPVLKIGSHYCFWRYDGTENEIVVFHLSGTTMVQDYVYNIATDDASGNPFYVKRGNGIYSDGNLLYFFGGYTSGYYDQYGLKVLEFNGTDFTERNRLYTFTTPAQPYTADTNSGYVEGTTFHLWNANYLTMVKFDPATNTFSEQLNAHSVTGTSNRLHVSTRTKRMYGDSNKVVYSYSPSGVTTIYSQAFSNSFFNNNHYMPLPASNPFSAIAPTPTPTPTPTRTPTPTPSHP